MIVFHNDKYIEAATIKIDIERRKHINKYRICVWIKDLFRELHSISFTAPDYPEAKALKEKILHHINECLKKNEVIDFTVIK